MCLGRQMKQALSEMVVVRSQAARETLLVLLRYDLMERLKRAEDSAELGEELRKQTDEARVQLEGDNEDDVLRVWRVKAIEDVEYSGRKVNGDLVMFEERDLSKT